MENREFRSFGDVLTAALQSSWREKGLRSREAAKVEFTEERQSGHKAAHKQIAPSYTDNVITLPVLTGRNVRKDSGRSSIGDDGEIGWSGGAGSNRCDRFGRPGPNHSATTAEEGVTHLRQYLVKPTGDMSGRSRETRDFGESVTAPKLTGHKARPNRRGRFYKDADGRITNSVRGSLHPLTGVCGGGSGQPVGGQGAVRPEPCAVLKGIDYGAI